MLPESLTSIGTDVFVDCYASLVLTVPRDSYACQYAIENGISYTLRDQ